MTDATVIDDPWSYWRETLAGLETKAVNEDPQPGFYRTKRKAHYGARKTFEPVIYWFDDTGLQCHVGLWNDPAGARTTEQAQALWQYVCKNPVTQEAWKVVAEDEGLWPDEHPLVAMGSNQAPDDDTYEGLRDAIEPLATEAKRLLAGPPAKTQVEADQITNLADRLSQLWTKAETLRKAEKKPFDEGARLVQEKWVPLTSSADQFKNLKYKLVTPFLQAEERAAKQAAEAAAENARLFGVEGAVEEAPPPRARAGTRGRAVTLRTEVTAEIADYDLVYQHFKKNAELQFCLHALATKAIRAGFEIPGASRKEQQKAV